jgi:hypothetical protein
VWTAKKREAYANDLGDAHALIAVSAGSNRSENDQDPATWQPPAAGCRRSLTVAVSDGRRGRRWTRHRPAR